MMKNIFIILFTIFLFSDTVSHAQCNHAQDYAALRELYLATGGDNWTNNSGWPDSTVFINNPTLPMGTDMSSWYGVDCKNGRVDALNLSYNNLEGALPTLQLDSLRFIHLTNNQLSGTVPNFNFPIIRELALSFNGLVGQIPDFQFIPDTVYLYLDNNNLSGCFPESLKSHCGIGEFKSDNNPLLPWEGDFDQFCATDGSHTAQLGAPCRNGSQVDVIKDDCSCGDCSNPPDPPIIVCAEKTSSSVTFEWIEVEGATFYDVTIIEPASASGSNVPGTNQFIVTGLNLGQLATIEVTAIIDGPCESVTSLPHSCAAEDCGVIPNITIQPIAPICLPGSPINLDENLITIDIDIPGSVGVFTVNGTPATVFDPVALGAGRHTIVYTLTWEHGICQQQASREVVVNDETPLSDFTLTPGGCVLDSVTVTYTGGTSGGIYTWDFGSNVIGSYNGAGPHEVTWTNPGTKTISLIVSKDGCTSEETKHTVTVNPVLLNPKITCADQRIDGVTFGWDAVANANSYDIIVEIVGGGIIYQGNVTNLEYDVDGIPEGTQVKITVTAVSTNGCPNTTSTHTCIATSCPNAKITFENPVTTVCLTSNLGLIELKSNITDHLPNVQPTITWSSSNATTNSAINNSVTPATFNPQVAGVGNHFVKVTYQQKDCIWEDSLLITLKVVPEASFTSKDKICITDDLAVTYTGTSTGGRTLTWDNGGAMRTDLTATSYSFKFPAPGSYTIGLRVTLSGCESELFTKTIVVEDIPASPELNCSSRLDAVTFNWTAVPCATEYEVLINGVSKGRQTSLSYVADNLQEGERVTIEVQAISTCACPIAPVSLECQAKACPPAWITFPEYEGAKIVYCLGETPELIPLHFNITNPIEGVMPEITWTNSNEDVQKAIDNDTIPATFDPYRIGMGNYNLHLSYRQGSCVWIDSLLIQVIDPDVTTLYPDTIWLGKGEIETINILANDILPAYAYTVTIKEFPTSELTLVDFDVNGQLTVTTDEDLTEEQIITYEVCDLCGACYEGQVYVFNTRLGGITQTMLITPHESTNQVLQFSEQPIEGSELWIYNRWGQLIFHQETYQNDWIADGYPGGVYYYVFKVYGMTVKRALTVVK
ncbi:MAG: gliding motility-associated C-terminal domain-containing protein [Chitinophagales bacterium]|nr:gliding motility-associated C-terminal domain-containing protein [Chitinophagales bacterium]